VDVGNCEGDGTAVAARKLLTELTPEQADRLAYYLAQVKLNRYGQVSITIHDGEVHMVQATVSEKISRKMPRNPNIA
jgi:hypothetical protein